MSEKITPERIAELRALAEADRPLTIAEIGNIRCSLFDLLDAASENVRLREELDWTQRMAKACGASIGKYEGGRP